MTADLFSLAQARQLRDEGQALAASTFNAAFWLIDARETAYKIARHKGQVSADDVLFCCPRPDWVSPNCVGSLFKDKRFKLVGYKQSTKTSAHARRIAIWSLNE